MTYLLFTIYLVGGCHSDGPFIGYGTDGKTRSNCPDRYVQQFETTPGFRSLRACEAEARQRWNDTRYAAISRCAPMK